jgi:dynactin complex subunit
VPILAVVACVAILALVVTKARTPAQRAARRVDERVAENNTRAMHDSAGSQLIRLERAIDAIAVEVERIGENQRFLTKLLANEPPQNARSEQDRRDL